MKDSLRSQSPAAHAVPTLTSRLSTNDEIKCSHAILSHDATLQANSYWVHAHAYRHDNALPALAPAVC